MKQVIQVKRIFIVAGEHSGDALGGKVMQALKRASPQPIEFSGVGGEAMEAQGLTSLFPMGDVAVMGPIDIAKALPRIVRRVYQTVDAALSAKPDMVLIIDSPEFTHPIAKRIRKAMPDCPIINYVSPTVWAWRPGRAKKMKPYVDHVLALLPFEPAAHQKLGGPACTYVGHPMIEKYDWIQSLDTSPLAQKLGLSPDDLILVMLPGSRPNEVKRLLKPFHDTVQELRYDLGPIKVLIPVVPSVQNLIEDGISDWPEQPHLIFGETDKFTSFRLAKAALAASGTVTLELAIAGTPMVVGYKADMIIAFMRGLIQVDTIILANLVLEEKVFPEFIQEECTGSHLAKALKPLLSNTTEREKQCLSLGRLHEKMLLPAGSATGDKPSDAAAHVIVQYLAGKRPAHSV